MTTKIERRIKIKYRVRNKIGESRKKPDADKLRCFFWI